MSGFIFALFFGLTARLVRVGTAPGFMVRPAAMSGRPKEQQEETS
jgi:hypothetical protein